MIEGDCWSKAECDGQGQCRGVDLACVPDGNCFEAFCDPDTQRCNQRPRANCGVLEPSSRPNTTPGPTPPGQLAPEAVSPNPSKSQNPNRGALALTGLVTKTPSTTNKENKNGKDTQNDVFENDGINWVVAGIGMTLIACAGCFAVIFGVLAARKEEARGDRLTAILDSGIAENDVFASPLVD